MQVRRFCAQQLKCHTEVPKIPRQLTQFTFLGIMTNVHNAYDEYMTIMTILTIMTVWSDPWLSGQRCQGLPGPVEFATVATGPG